MGYRKLGLPQPDFGRWESKWPHASRERMREGKSDLMHRKAVNGQDSLVCGDPDSISWPRKVNALTPQNISNFVPTQTWLSNWGLKHHPQQNIINLLWYLQIIAKKYIIPNNGVISLPYPCKLCKQKKNFWYKVKLWNLFP